ncbi:MAG: P-loop NTPase, partial [Eubacterium sp.]|nr:P-loop NTPase [Eubacterium sp.]
MKKILNFNNLDLYSVVRDVIKRIWIVLMVGCIGIMVSFAFLKREYKPTYTSSAIYVINPSQSTGYVRGNKMAAESVVDAFKSLLESDIMGRKIKKDLRQLDYTDTVREANLIEGTNLMKFTVTASDPIEAYQTISVVMNNYYELSSYLSSDAVFDVIREPTIAQNPDNAFTPRIRSLEIGGICALICFFVLILLSMMRKTVKTEKAVEEILEANLLGTIYHEEKNRTIKAKVVQSVKSLLITSPIITNKFIESFNNIRTKIEYEKEKNTSKNAFMVTSVCENEGKSTVALNMALSLAKEGKSVILIDADMRKPATFKMLDIPKKQITDMSNLLLGKIGLDEAIYKGKD